MRSSTAVIRGALHVGRVGAPLATAEVKLAPWNSSWCETLRAVGCRANVNADADIGFFAEWPFNAFV